MFFLCGLWHGASWNFVIWGLWHGSFLVVERVDRRRGHAARAIAAGVRAWPIWPHVYTLVVVMIGWVFFRADTLPGAIAFLKAMAGLRATARRRRTRVRWYLTPELWLALVAGVDRIDAVGAGAGGAGRGADAAGRGWSVSLRRARRRSIALLVASIMQVAARTYNPFIYFRF